MAWRASQTSTPHALRISSVLKMQRRTTVTVDESLARKAEEDVAVGRAPSVSAWVATAMAERAKKERLADVLADTRAELGPATEEEVAWARSVLGL